MEYNYVVLGVSTDFYMAAYDEVNRLGYGEYKYKLLETNNKFLTYMYRAHTSERINSLVNLPFKKIWNRWVVRPGFSDNKPICFVFFAGDITKNRINHGFIEYLRKKNKNCKIVLFCQDLISKSFPNDFDYYREKFDAIFSFDQYDAKKYGLQYHSLVYSELEPSPKYNIKNSDVYFVGKAKDRLDKILSVYKQLRALNLVCDFYITGVPSDKQAMAEEIHYCTQMPYLENIEHIRATRCMLEIMQGGGHGYTLRYCEAITYGKKIITDNPEIENAPFFDSSKILKLGDKEIDRNFITSGERTVLYDCKELISPKHLMETIDDYLKNREE